MSHIGRKKKSSGYEKILKEINLASLQCLFNTFHWQQLNYTSCTSANTHRKENKNDNGFQIVWSQTPKYKNTLQANSFPIKTVKRQTSTMI